MTDIDTLKALRERVRKAEGPLDYETAARIHALGEDAPFKRYTGIATGDAGEDEITYEIDKLYGRCSCSEFNLPDRSVDAALALVERLYPRCTKQLVEGDGFEEHEGKWVYMASLWPPFMPGENWNEQIVEVHVASLALALICAALSARIAELEGAAAKEAVE